MLGGREGLARLLVGGKLVAVVLNRPGAPPESEDIERNYRDEFDRRFLLLTAQNLDAVARVYPQLF
jgi:hypothetical protein